MKKVYTPKMVEIIRAKYPVTDTRELAAELGVSYGGLKAFVHKDKAVRKRNRHALSPSEIDRIQKEYPHMKTQDLADKMGLKYWQVSNYAHDHKILKTEEFLRSPDCNRLDGIRGSETRFKKGDVSHNKGKKMSPELYEKCKGTMFKKGHKPASTKWDGYEWKDKNGYVWRRISEGKFKQVHIIMWEEANGPVPAGCVIVFKDRNQNNLSIDNLDCISKQDNMNRNSIIRYPRELQQLIRINHKLKREINGKEQDV
jgi:hypothetical protein